MLGITKTLVKPHTHQHQPIQYKMANIRAVCMLAGLIEASSVANFCRIEHAGKPAAYRLPSERNSLAGEIAVLTLDS